MRQWKPYTNERLIYEHPEGFFVIKEKDANNSLPLFCPLCDKISVTFYDEESLRRFECCDLCANLVIFPRLEDWKNGWRPTKEDVESKSR